jgi:hypothetical protein
MMMGEPVLLLRERRGSEGPETATRGGRGEWEAIKIPHRNMAYVPKSNRRPSLLTRSRLNSYSKTVSRRNRARNCNDSTEWC